MRDDGLPILFTELPDDPKAPFRKLGNWNIDDFGAMVGTCFCMWQGWFKFMDSSDHSLIQLPFALIDLDEGDLLVNHRTGAEYEIRQVLWNARRLKYKNPLVDGVIDLVPFESRRIRKGFHPDELVGVGVQIKRVNGDGIDLDQSRGDFLTLGSSNRASFRQRYAETEDVDSSGYSVRWQVEVSEPGSGSEPFRDVRAPKKMRRPKIGVKTDDPTMIGYIDGQFFDNLVQFDLQAPSASELSIMTNWFMAFMERYAPVLEKEGFNRVLFWDRRAKNEVLQEKPEGGDGVRLRYYVRTEKLSMGIQPRFRKITIETKLKPEPEDS